MVTLLHLSDIHFSPRDDLSQFDIDQQIRRALIEDLALKPAKGANYDALLITGDIAYSGTKDDYTKAQKWLDEVFMRTGLSPANTYMVPGNHDVDRKYVEPEFPLWDSHVRLRETKDPVIWRDVIAKQLQKDPLHTMLAPLTGYNDFAQGYECRTEPNHLAWQRKLSTPLDDGRPLRLHGINSALISDAGDAPDKLLVSEFQTSHLGPSSGVIEIVMCHHPPDWLMDKATIRNVLRSFAPIALFGHEHSTRILGDAKQVQLFAGAVQPSRRDPGDWLPTYHIVQLSIVAAEKDSELLVRIHTREFKKDDYRFHTRYNEKEQPMDEHRLQVPAWTPPSPTATISRVHGTPQSQPGVTSAEVVQSAEQVMSTPTEIAQRELLVNFFRLGTPDRYGAANEAGLLRDGDDALNPQAMWAEVFRRANQEPNALSRFWVAVAKRTPQLKDTPNPFGA